MPVEPQESPQSPLTGALGSLIEQRKSIVGAAHSPLVFFVLALLIIEVFIICAGAFFDLPPSYRVGLLYAGIGLFLVVFGTVAALVVFVPRNVVFGEESHLRYAALERYGSDQHGVSANGLRDMTPTAPPAITQEQPALQLPQADQGESQ
ncbi:hypothetical protein PQQ87_24115 [Paraburkholderia nemoris]|uniref:hypothetical protein n=1 Tax=Paraburkholderia nemoris TaxID=2793076 RepID=UPI0038BA935D